MKYKQVGSAVGLMLGCMLAGNATAGWGSSGGYYGGSSGGYTASYGSSGGYVASYGSSGGYSSYGSSGGSSGRPGLIGRVALGIRSHFAAKRARHIARRSYYGSSGYSSYGSSGGYSASYGSSGYTTSYRAYSGGSSGGSSGYSTYYGGSSGTSVSYGSTGSVGYGSTGSVSYGSTGTYYGASNTTTSKSIPMALASNVSTTNDSVHLTVSVPASAKIFVNGNETTSTGAVRQFVSRGLQAGKNYRFQVRAELDAADGSTLTDEKEVVVSAGQFEQLQFAFAESAAPIETAVTLNVPEDAEVTLAGSNTSVTGASRVFRTNRLLVGDVWDDYEIQVKLNGQVKTQKIRLIAGDDLELSFNFDESPDRLASR